MKCGDGASDGEVMFSDDGVDPVKSALHDLNEAFSAVGDDLDYLAEVVTQAAGAAVVAPSGRCRPDGNHESPVGLADQPGRRSRPARLNHGSISCNNRCSADKWPLRSTAITDARGSNGPELVVAHHMDVSKAGAPPSGGLESLVIHLYYAPGRRNVTTVPSVTPPCKG